LVRHEIRTPPLTPWRRTAPSESQEVLRPGASETGFRASQPEAQSGAHSKKPRVVRGSERLTTRLSELAGLVLAVQKRLFNQLAQFSELLLLAGSGIQLTSCPKRSLTEMFPMGYIKA